MSEVPTNYGSTKKKRKSKKLKTISCEQTAEVLESSEGKRFGLLLEAFLEEEDIQSSKLREEQANDSTGDKSPGKHQVSNVALLNDLWAETAKLKTNGSLSRVPTTPLTRLVAALNEQLQIESFQGIKEPAQKKRKEDHREEERTINNAFTACLIILNIVTTPNIDLTVVSEEVIENLLRFVKYHFTHTIFPTFDPSYGIENAPSKKSKGNKKGSSKYSKALLNKGCQVLDLLNEYCMSGSLTDAIILDLTAISLPTFFVEGVSEMQLNALKVIRTIFSRYDRHRNLILDDVFSSLSKLPTSKRTLRNYKLSEEKGSIQMVSALVLQLIQCCPCLDPSIKPSSSVDLPEAGGNTDSNSYEAAVTCAHTFVQSFVSKCSTREEENYRPLLGNFVEDLLHTLNLPEWPASEVLLKVLSSILMKNLRKESSETNILKMLSIDLLGSIAAKVKLVMKQALHWREILPQPVEETKKGDSMVEDDSCICERRRSDNFMLDCDKCHKWFHGSCVGVSPHQVPDTWYCDSCFLRQKVEERRTTLREMAQSQSLSQNGVDQLSNSNPLRKGRKGKGGPSLELAEITEDLDLSENDYSLDQTNEELDESKSEEELLALQEMVTMRQLLLDYLAEKSRAEPSLVYARHFLIAQWCHACQAQEEGGEESDAIVSADYYRQQCTLPKTNGVDPSERILPRLLSRDIMMKINRFLLTRSSLAKSFDAMLSRILNLLNENLTTFRAKAIKALSIVLEADPAVLGESSVKQAVTGRFWDQAVSVRGAAVDLVGQYILYRPEFASAYSPMIQERILDTGVSVRKRVVKILSDVCLRQPQNPMVTSICQKLASRMNDEEAIKAIVLKTFQTLWFSHQCLSTLPHQSAEQASEGLSQVNTDSQTLDGRQTGSSGVDAAQQAGTSSDGQISLDMQSRIDQIIHVVARTAHHEWFVDLLQKLLSDERESSKQTVHKICQDICASLVDRILALDEEGTASRLTSEDEKNYKLDPTLCLPAILATLKLFCQAEPVLLVPHVTTLHPYLKLQANDLQEHLIIKNLASIIENTAPHITHFEKSFLSTLERDLVDLLYKLKLPGGFNVLGPCAKCLCTIVSVLTHNSALLHDVLNKFEQFIQKAKQTNQLPSHVIASLCRSLFCAGSLCKYYDFEKGNTQSKALTDMYSLYIHFTGSENPEIQLRALQGIGNLFIRCPRLMLKPQTNQLLKKALQSEDPKIRLQVLKNFVLFLKEEEERITKMGANNTEGGGSGLNLSNCSIEGIMQSDGDELSQDLEKPLDDLFVEMDHSDSGVSSGVLQTHLPKILEQCMDPIKEVRATAVEVLEVIFRQGLVHPLQCVAHLVALETDQEPSVADRAHKLIIKLTEKHPTFLSNRFVQGIELSFNFQQQSFGKVCAYTTDQTGGGNVSVFGKLYTLFSGKRNSRQQFLSSVLNLFEKSTTQKKKMVKIEFFRYIAEALVSLSYTSSDEVLYIIYCANRIISLEGGTVLSQLQKLYSKKATPDPAAIAKSEKLFMKAAKVMILLTMKQLLKQAYGLTNSKCKEYHPNEQSKQPHKKADAGLLNFTEANSPFAAVPTFFNMKNKAELHQFYKTFKEATQNDESDYNPAAASNGGRRGGGRQTASRSKRKQQQQGSDDSIEEDATNSNTAATENIQEGGTEHEEEPTKKRRTKKSGSSHGGGGGRRTRKATTNNGSGRSGVGSKRKRRWADEEEEEDQGSSDGDYMPA
ncbi:Nipped-B-like protein A (Fragment), variant 2 [Balamuthia mandrillaris]